MREALKIYGFQTMGPGSPTSFEIRTKIPLSFTAPALMGAAISFS
jgi:hypothetical protein